MSDNPQPTYTPTYEELKDVFDIAKGELDKITKIVREHEEDLHSYSGDDISRRVAGILRHYQSIAEQQVSKQKTLRDDLLVWFRAMAMNLEMTGNAGTHAEKGARLRGAIDLTESVIGKLRDMTFDLQWSHSWPDFFRSDFPVREYMNRAHRAEAEKEAAEQRAVLFTRAMARLPEGAQADIQKIINELRAEDKALKGNGHREDAGDWPL